ncbi:hypothetical protein D3C84_683650 [compost metagenome]
MQAAFCSGQGDTTREQAPAEHLLPDEANSGGLGGLHQFADHPVGVDEMPGARKEQPALDPLAQLRRGFAHGLRRPEVDGHLLLAHACPQRLERFTGFGALEHQQRAVFLQQPRPVDPRQ